MSSIFFNLSFYNISKLFLKIQINFGMKTRARAKLEEEAHRLCPKHRWNNENGRSKLFFLLLHFLFIYCFFLFISVTRSLKRAMQLMMLPEPAPRKIVCRRHTIAPSIPQPRTAIPRRRTSIQGV